MLEFIESPLFERLVHDYLTDEEYAALQLFLAANPDAGDVIPGSGGCRKVRWRTGRSGKRGGVRAIYLARPRSGQIWLLTIYDKATSDAIPAHLLRAIRDEIFDT